MKTVLIGVGQAGGKLSDQIVTFDRKSGHGAVQNAVALNSDTADLKPLSIDTVLFGQDYVRGHGVGGDNELGAEIMGAEISDIIEKVDKRITPETESITLVAGLGGGTGSGGSSMLARRLTEIYEIPIYLLAILPSTRETNLVQVNAARSLKTVTKTVDATIVVDNDAWTVTDQSLTNAYDQINQKIAQRVGRLLAAGEVSNGVAESVVDTSEIINTLRTGGIAAIGYHQTEAAESADRNIDTVLTATRSAYHSGLSLTGETTADSGLLVIIGHPDRISRKGVEKSRKWLENETGSKLVRGGDFPTDSDHISALVVLGGIQHSDRIEELFDRANRAAATRSETADTDQKLFQNSKLEGL